jgi:hypothetical protein
LRGHFLQNIRELAWLGYRHQHRLGLRKFIWTKKRRLRVNPIQIRVRIAYRCVLFLFRLKQPVNDFNQAWYRPRFWSVDVFSELFDDHPEPSQRHL